MKKETLKIQNISLSVIDRPAVPDRLSINPDYIKELAASIAEIGLLQPVVLCPRDGRYEIVAGDCRFQAFLSLGRSEIPAIIQKLDNENVSIARATENLQREGLTVIEEARVYKTLHDDHGMSWDKIAKRTGKTPGLVKRRYDLLKMPEIIIKALHEKKISYTVAEELCRLPDIGRIEYYLGFCIDHGATNAVVKDWVKEEQSLARQKVADVGGVEWGSPLPDAKPIYVACDLCSGAMEINKVVYLRICKECRATIKQNM